MKRAQPIYDFEFLLEPIMPDAPFVYLYRSGFMKTKIRGALDSLARGKDWKPVWGADVNQIRPFEAATEFECELLGGQPYIFCDWAYAKKDKIVLKQQRLRMLKREAATHSAHFVPHDVKRAEPELWAQVENSCFVVEEPVITNANMVKILGYLDRTNVYMKNACLAKDLAFVSRFRDMLEPPRPAIGDIVNNYTLQVLICLDPVTGQFDFDRHHKLWAKEVSSVTPYGRLLHYLQARDASNLDRLVTSLATYAADQNWTAAEFYCRICNITSRLIRSEIASRRQSKNRRSGIKSIATLDMALWAALVLAWGPPILSSKTNSIHVARGPSTLIAQFHALCCAFETRMSKARWDGDPLEDLWDRIGSDFPQFHRSKAVSESRRRLAEQLSDFDMPVQSHRWIRMLGTLKHQ